MTEFTQLANFWFPYLRTIRTSLRNIRQIFYFCLKNCLQIAFKKSSLHSRKRKVSSTLRNFADSKGFQKSIKSSFDEIMIYLKIIGQTSANFMVWMIFFTHKSGERLYCDSNQWCKKLRIILAVYLIN